MVLDADGNLHVAWWGSANGEMFYSKLTDGHWSGPTQISTTSTDDYGPEIAVDAEGHPHVVWRGSVGEAVFIFYSADMGAGWSEPLNISTTATNNQYPQIALDSDGDPHVTWCGDTSDGSPIYYSKKTGGVWSAAVIISTTSDCNTFPQIDLDRYCNPNIVWTGQSGGVDNVCYARNDGSGWSTPVVVSTNAPIQSGGPTIAVDQGGFPHVAWGGRAASTPYWWSVYYSERSQNGWSTPVMVSAAPPSGVNGFDTLGTMALDPQGDPHIVWDHCANQIYYSSKTGETWNRPTMLSGSRTSSNPRLALDTGGNPHVTWMSSVDADNSAIFYTADAGASPTWYLAEGTNAWDFYTYTTIENPSDRELHARIMYMDPNPETGAGRAFQRTVTLPPLSQTTISSEPDIGEVDFSTRVECLEGETIAVDRTMYWTGEGAPCPEGHSSVAATSPSKTWYLPEGSSTWGFETWTLVQNPNGTDADVTLTYMTEDEGPIAIQKTVPAYSRGSFDMGADIGEHDSSVQVTSDLPVIAERSQYRNGRREGSCSVGAPAPATDYYLAEGTTAWGFETYLLVQNPNDSDAEVTLTFMTPDGPIGQDPFTIAANSRKTVKVSELEGLENTDLSARVHADRPVVAERSMYWNGGPDSGQACHASIGLSSTSNSFFLPDGQTSEGWQTWTLVANPHDRAVPIEVTYLPQGGGEPVSFTDTIAAGSRATYEMADKIPEGRASVLVRTLDISLPVLVERSMYSADRGLGTDTIGAFE